jgi:elongation factor G
VIWPRGGGCNVHALASAQKAGAIGARGSIERGNTVSDHDPLERRMQHSLNAR